uniref:Phosducin domain-containing protein n=1 Tax=Ditylum brightwellii TaxID=49249 RepID=A0A6U3QXS5_9STRA|mmetsp:Transcript_21441/g.31861  ORF Transcript_21441/g.31861 Transcript_21441/m.31861 type:complete len:374 (+) Transcript_21441:173-1294(+)
MSGLEDRILKQNIPGKYSWWDNDDEARPNHHHDDGDNDNDENNSLNEVEQVKQWDAQGVPKPLQISALEGGPVPHNGGKSQNTGAKGVLNDYRQTRAIESHNRQVEALERQDLLRRATEGATLQQGDVAMSAAAVEQRRKLEKRRDDSDDDDDNEDDEFLKNYRKNRLRQLQLTTHWPSYDGKVEEVTPEEYSSLVDTIDPRVHFIVHLYEPSIRDCVKLNSMLERCASLKKYAKFVKLRALDAKPNMDCIVLPTIMIYRGGNLEHNLVRFTQKELVVSRGEFRVEDVLETLESYGVVNPTSVESTAMVNSGMTTVVAPSTNMGYSLSTAAESSYAKTTTIMSKYERDEESDDYDSDDADLDEFCKDFQSSNF